MVAEIEILEPVRVHLAGAGINLGAAESKLEEAEMKLEVAGMVLEEAENSAGATAMMEVVMMAAVMMEVEMMVAVVVMVAVMMVAAIMVEAILVVVLTQEEEELKLQMLEETSCSWKVTWIPAAKQPQGGMP